MRWSKAFGSITTERVVRGHPDTEFSVVVGNALSAPSLQEMREVRKARNNGPATPVAVIVTYHHGGEQQAAILGPDEKDVVHSALEVALAERLLTRALALPNLIALTQGLRRQLGTLVEGRVAGFRNEGLLATHVLRQQPGAPEWSALCERAVPLLRQSGTALLTALGYTIDALGEGLILRDKASSERRAAALVLLDNEPLDNPLNRFNGATAVAHGLAVARREGVDWLIVVGGTLLRLYPVDPDTGVGRKGHTQTFVEIDLAMLSGEQAGYLTLLFAPEALATAGTLARLLDESARFATSLSDRLRERIYTDVIPTLAVSVAHANGVADLPPAEQRAGLDEAYHQAMIVLFRLLFVAYAEDRALLPIETNDAYRANALKTLGQRMLADGQGEFSGDSHSLWRDLTQIWEVIDTGDLEGMGVPAYNGGLFTRDAAKNPSGAATYTLDLVNSRIGPVLRGLLIDTTDDGVPGLVDFRALDVREFGTIYEGLLESGLGIADTDLTVDDKDTYIPATKQDQVIVPAGAIYFHSRSGSRKATGSYFTKPFAVHHLLDTALEPTIAEHLDRVAALRAKGSVKAAARALFDFRVVDLAMGSAHFLVAAIDRIEARFSEFLAEQPIPEVTNELTALRRTAAAQLGAVEDDAGIDDGMLLRRQIARRCIYGIDINEIAVELARLAVWIHTFVPGLPLSFLDHGLVHGNSLTGVGTLEEIVTSLEEAEKRETRGGDGVSMYLPAALDDFMARAGEQLDQLAEIADASISDVRAAAEAQGEIMRALEPLAALCDLITAERTTRVLRRNDPEKIWLKAGGGALFTASNAVELEAAILGHPDLERAREIASSVQAAHVPVIFPEVFRRHPAGFDVILGNPPWEKLKVEEHAWWALRFPGLRSMSQLEKNRALERYRSARPDLVAVFTADVVAVKGAAGVLTAGPFPGIGATDIDLFAAFCWRFWHEMRHGGRIGVVLPRTALSGSATAEWRREVLRGGAIADLTTLTNTGHWVFAEVHPQYTIALLTASKGIDRGLRLRGPLWSLVQYRATMSQGDAAVAAVSADEVERWSDSVAIPLVPAAEMPVFAAMKQHPRFASDSGHWAFRPMRELDTTKEKRFFDFDHAKPKTSHTLQVWTGGSFELWDPDYGKPYAFAEPRVVEGFLQEKRLTQIKLSSSAFYVLSEEWAQDPSTLPMRSPRIAFRDVCRATDSRTMICALIPGDVTVVHKAPYLFRQAGGAAEEAYVLAMLSSLPFDWITRRYVELAMTFELLNSFPVPRVDPETGRTLDVDGVVRRSGPDLRPVRDRVIEISGRLAAVDERYAEWAAEVGVPVGSVTTPEEKDDLIFELDALVSLLYGLSADHVETIFSTFHRGWAYEDRLKAVLAHYEQWAATL